MQTDSALSRTQRFKAALIAALGSPIIAAICSTLRCRVDGAEYWDEVVRSGRSPILACWHGRIFGGVCYFRHRDIVVITSRNFDGEWIARIIRRFGFDTARGSTSQGGARALVRLRQDLRAGRPVAFTLDGPRGPARVAQPGAVWLAGATGNPILPFHIESNRFWTLNSWDRTQIPKPFSTIAVAIGEPIVVTGTDADAVDAALAGLQDRLRTLETRATQLLSSVLSR
jgi:lysophospholipid acyltransferase (LPLAT)-like uncharacterized protein